MFKYFSVDEFNVVISKQESHKEIVSNDLILARNGAEPILDFKYSNGEFTAPPVDEVNIDSVTLLIKNEASRLISDIENSWQMTRAKDRVTLESDYTEFDLLLAQKEAIRVASNQAELDIIELTQDKLEKYQFTVDLSAVRAPQITRITVGAFWARLTGIEYKAVNGAASADDDLALAIAELNARTHVDILSTKVITQMKALELGGVLGAVIDDTFASRADEVLRGGDSDEAYRGA